MRAQQRTSQRRRNKPNPGGAQLQTYDWEATLPGSPFMRITLIDTVTGAPITREGFVENGLPKFEARGNPARVIQYVQEVDGWTLEFDGPLNLVEDVFRLPNLDDLRGPGGLFLTGKTMETPIGPPTPIPTEAVGVIIAGTGVQILLNIPGLDYAATASAQLATLNGDPNAIDFFFGVNDLIITWATPAASGDVVNFGPNPIAIINNTGGPVVPSTFVIP